MQGKCLVCGRSEDWHKHNTTQHQYSATDSRITVAPPSPPAERRPRGGKPMLGDPILRIALIRKGLLTSEDILEAEMEFTNARIYGTPIALHPTATQESASVDLAVSHGSDQPAGDGGGS